MALKISTFPGRRILVGDKSYLYFGGTAYLGVQTHPDFQSILIRNIQRYGTNYGASRLSNVQVEIYDDSEQNLSQWVGSEACITLSSGYLAGQLLAGYFDNSKYSNFYLANTHSSLYRSAEQVYNDFRTTRAMLEKQIDSGNKKTPVLFMDSIDLEGSSYPDYGELRTLPLESCILVADDSHGLGLLGSEGQGAYSILNEIGAKELIVCGSLGKSFGLQAGIIFGMKSRIDSLKQTPLFAGASPTAASNLVSLIEATPLYARQRNLLADNVARFIDGLKHPELFHYIDSYPVFLSKDEGLAGYLFDNGISITHFHYPAENSFQSRIVISAIHTSPDIDRITGLINQYPEDIQE